MQQIARQLSQRQLHPALVLGVTRLRGQQGHGRSRRGWFGCRDQRLQQRGKHRIKAEPRTQPFGQLPFQR